MGCSASKGDAKAGGGAGEEKKAVKKTKQAGINPEHMSVDPNFVLQSFPKSPEAQAVIQQGMAKNILFSSLEPQQMSDVMGAMKKVECQTGDKLITQGDVGDQMYIVETGKFDILVKGVGNVGVSGAGGSFGELSLMMNQNRAATVQATEPSVAWSLDRATFRHYLSGSSSKKLEETMADLKSNEMFSTLTNDHLRKLATAVQVETFNPGETLFNKGDIGDKFYVIKQGDVECSDIIGPDGVNLNNVPLGAGATFGERALIKQEPRAATITAKTATTCMVVSGEDFTSLLGNLEELMEKNLAIRVMQSMVDENALSHPVMQKLEAALESVDLSAGAALVTQGKGAIDSLYVIGSGSIKMSGQTGAGFMGTSEKVLNAGQFLCEDGFKKAVVAAAAAGAPAAGSGGGGGVSADDVAVDVASGGAPAFGAVAASQTKLWKVTYAAVAKAFDEAGGGAGGAGGFQVLEAPKFEELEVFQTLGTGTFGRVKLALFKSKDGGEQKVAALKALKKQSMAEQNQLAAILSEREILVKLKHPFVLQLYTTYQDTDVCYFLLEFVQGGELFNRLAAQPEGWVSDGEAAFYAACAADALAYVHSIDILYRDLKPENILVDLGGYIRVVDFGFAKVVMGQTHTVCGTPEYLSPECALGKGYYKDIDMWALGVLIYEMTVGYTPFSDPSGDVDTMKIFRRIIDGKIAYPEHMSKQAKAIVKEVLQKQLNKRLGNQKGGMQDIKDHKWFSGVHFDQLVAKKTEAPWKPPISDPLDCSNFDPYDEEDIIPPYKGDQSVFASFTQDS